MKRALMALLVLGVALLLGEMFACDCCKSKSGSEPAPAPAAGDDPGKQVTRPSDEERQAAKQIDRTPPADDRPPMPLDWVTIPAGTFIMGCEETTEGCAKKERPRHEVRISTAFQMNPTTVTNQQYRLCVEAGACSLPTWADWYNTLPANFPVVGVTWYQAKAFCEWAGGSLPTEAQWEYAARGGVDAPTYGPMDDIAWHRTNSNRTLHPAGLKTPNAYGLYDMLGNVWEWCADYYDADYYAKSPSVDPTGPESSLADYRVLRGSNYNTFRRMDVAERSNDEAGNAFDGVGFRCVRTAF